MGWLKITIITYVIASYVAMTIFAGWYFKTQTKTKAEGKQAITLLTFALAFAPFIWPITGIIILKNAIKKD